MPKGRLVLHTKYVDEIGGVVEMKVYEVPRTMSTPTATSIPWSIFMTGFDWLVTTIMNGKAIIATIEPSRHPMHSDLSIASSMTFSSMWQPS